MRPSWMKAYSRAADWSEVFHLPAKLVDDSGCCTVQFSNCSRLIMVNRGKHVQVCCLKHHSIVYQLDCSQSNENVNTVAWAPDNRLAISLTKQSIQWQPPFGLDEFGCHSVVIVDPESSQQLQLTHAPFQVRSMQWAPSGAQLMGCNEYQGKVALWTIEHGSFQGFDLTGQLQWAIGMASSATMSPDGCSVCVLAGAAIGVIDIQSWKMMHTHKLVGGEVTHAGQYADSIKFLNNGRALSISKQYDWHMCCTHNCMLTF